MRLAATDSAQRPNLGQSKVDLHSALKTLSSYIEAEFDAEQACFLDADEGRYRRLAQRALDYMHVARNNCIALPFSRRTLPASLPPVERLVRLEVSRRSPRTLFSVVQYSIAASPFFVAYVSATSEHGQYAARLLLEPVGGRVKIVGRSKPNPFKARLAWQPDGGRQPERFPRPELVCLLTAPALPKHLAHHLALTRQAKVVVGDLLEHDNTPVTA